MNRCSLLLQRTETPLNRHLTETPLGRHVHHVHGTVNYNAGELTVLHSLEVQHGQPCTSAARQ